MPKLTDLIKIAYKNAYDLSAKKQYSEPKIFDWGGDLSKRWYVYFSFRNPVTGNLKPQPTVDTGINQYKTEKGRRKAAEILRDVISKELKDGYNPYVIGTGETNVGKVQHMDVAEAIEYVLEIKKRSYAETSFPDFKSRLTQFKKWLYSKGYRGRSITEVNKIAVNTYLTEILLKTSARNRNNTRTALSTMYTQLVSDFVVPHNFIDEIAIPKAVPVRNKSYTESQEDEILNFLEQHDKLLLLYIYFVSYNILRPIEVNRLLIEDIDLKGRKMQLRAKNQPVKTKIIPDILFEQLPDLTKSSKKDYLFGLNGIGQSWDAKETSRSTEYSKRFNRVVKQPFGLGKEYGFYSFRHTIISRLMANLLKECTPLEAESRAMLITGHTSIKGFRSYLRNIDAKLPDDYSKWIIKND